MKRFFTTQPFLEATSINLKSGDKFLWDLLSFRYPLESTRILTRKMKIRKSNFNSVELRVASTYYRIPFRTD